jgi:pimeloyl-ACP methyl ester carboxylesterase
MRGTGPRLRGRRTAGFTERTPRRALPGHRDRQRSAAGSPVQVLSASRHCDACGGRISTKADHLETRDAEGRRQRSRAVLRSPGHGAASPADHGATGDDGHFDALADLLADEFTVVSYDRRGNGRSPVATGWQTTSPEEQADDAAALLAALGTGPAAVFGTSGGGVFALCLLVRHPELVRGLILHEPGLYALVDNFDSVRAPIRALVEDAKQAGGVPCLAGAPGRKRRWPSLLRRDSRPPRPTPRRRRRHDTGSTRRVSRIPLRVRGRSAAVLRELTGDGEARSAQSAHAASESTTPAAELRNRAASRERERRDSNPRPPA